MTAAPLELHPVTGEFLADLPEGCAPSDLLPLPEGMEPSFTVRQRAQILGAQLAVEHHDWHGNPFCPSCRGERAKSSLLRRLILDARFDPTTIPHYRNPDGSPLHEATGHAEGIQFGPPVVGSRAAAPELIEGVIPSGSVGFLLGPPSSLKSFVAVSMSVATAADEPWFGHGVDSFRPTLFLPGEGQAGIAARFLAAIDALDLPDGYIGEGDLTVSDRTPNLVTGADLEATLDYLRANQPGEWGLIVVDTLSTAAEGASQNDDQEMSLVMGNARRLQRAGGPHCVVLIVSHPTKNGSDLLAGSRVLRGGADFALSVERAGMQVTIRHEKHPKDGAPMRPVTLSAEEVDGTLVLRECSAIPSPLWSASSPRSRVIGALRTLAPQGWCSQAEIRDVIADDAFDVEVNRGTVHRELNRLIEEGGVEKHSTTKQFALVEGWTEPVPAGSALPTLEEWVDGE